MSRIAIWIGLGCFLAQAAQVDSVWQKELTSSFNFSNAQFDNWVGGGEDALSWNLKAKGVLKRKFTNVEWVNSLNSGFGMVQQGDEDLRKSLDRLFVESRVSFPLWKFVSPYVSTSLETQYAKGYDYTDTTTTLVSNFWDPGYLRQSIGLGYDPIPTLLLRSGFSLKETFSEEFGYADDVDTEDEEETFKLEPGLEGIAEYRLKLNDKLFYGTKLNTFINFQGIKAIDGQWENEITAQVAKYLQVSFIFEMLYDLDLSDSRQIRQNLEMGLTYSIF